LKLITAEYAVSHRILVEIKNMSWNNGSTNIWL
jgi:hypothetical protein